MRERQGFDTAQICMNGHVISATAGSSTQFQEKFCSSCGESTLMNCERCGEPIRGYYHVPGVYGGYDDLKPPSFCHGCSNPFPWTERRKQAAMEIFDGGNFDQAKIAKFESDLAEIAKDTPAAQPASLRIMSVIASFPRATANVLRDLVVDIASETAKKIIMEGQ